MESIEHWYACNGGGGHETSCRNVNREISGFRIRDAVFSAPIMGERDDKSQVQLRMSSSSMHSDESSTTFEFCVYSANVVVLLENRQGFTQVIYEEGRSEIAEMRQRADKLYRELYHEGIKKCTILVASDNMYDNFISNGQS
ncbi:unnamed protein product [Clonostachys rosea]|uniref:Uncharacterized protein n=1 Tax=Bionectria ochroleuca TaxID=29856 RepID=A0ABY6U0V8_BIOOC|nr:unnamed protein product [Clonostachys rosea]